MALSPVVPRVLLVPEPPFRRPRYGAPLYASADLPETPLKERDLGTIESTVVGLVGAAAVLGPGQVLRALKTVAPLIVPLSIADFEIFQAAKASGRVRTVLDATTERFLGTQGLNTGFGPREVTYPTLGSLFVRQALGELGETPLGEFVIELYGIDAGRHRVDATRALPPGQRRLSRADLLRFSDEALVKFIAALSRANDLNAAQRATLQLATGIYAMRLGIYASRGWIGQLTRSGTQPIGDKADP